MIRVYLLDDHEVVRHGLRDLLEREGDIEVVGESGSAVDAQHRIPALRPDVAVLDARLPDGSGIDVCREIRSVDPSIHALILTSFEDDEALFSAIMAGAAGYVLKQIRRGPEQPDELRALTEQERRILALVAEGLTNREIAQRMFLSEKTVKNYVSSLLAKLGMERRTQAAVLASKLLNKQ